MKKKSEIKDEFKEELLSLAKDYTKFKNEKLANEEGREKDEISLAKDYIKFRIKSLLELKNTLKKKETSKTNRKKKNLKVDFFALGEDITKRALSDSKLDLRSKTKNKLDSDNRFKKKSKEELASLVRDVVDKSIENLTRSEPIPQKNVKFNIKALRQLHKLTVSSPNILERDIGFYSPVKTPNVDEDYVLNQNLKIAKFVLRLLLDKKLRSYIIEILRLSIFKRPKRYYKFFAKTTSKNRALFILNLKDIHSYFLLPVLKTLENILKKDLNFFELKKLNWIEKIVNKNYFDFDNSNYNLLNLNYEENIFQINKNYDYFENVKLNSIRIFENKDNKFSFKIRGSHDQIVYSNRIVNKALATILKRYDRKENAIYYKFRSPEDNTLDDLTYGPDFHRKGPKRKLSVKEKGSVVKYVDKSKKIKVQKIPVEVIKDKYTPAYYKSFFVGTHAIPNRKWYSHYWKVFMNRWLRKLFVRKKTSIFDLFNSDKNVFYLLMKKRKIKTLNFTYSFNKLKIRDFFFDLIEIFFKKNFKFYLRNFKKSVFFYEVIKKKFLKCMLNQIKFKYLYLLKLFLKTPNKLFVRNNNFLVGTLFTNPVDVILLFSNLFLPFFHRLFNKYIFKDMKRLRLFQESIPEYLTKNKITWRKNIFSEINLKNNYRSSFKIINKKEYRRFF